VATRVRRPWPVRGRSSGRPDCRLRRLARAGPYRRPPRAQRDGRLKCRYQSGPFIEDGAAEDRRCPRLRLLHEPAVAQGSGADREPRGCLAVPVASTRAAGADRRHSLGRRRSRGRRVLRLATTGISDRCVGITAVAGRSRPEVSRGALRAGVRVVPRPPQWGGFLVRPHRIEFWQGRPGRMHDRIAFDRVEQTGWTTSRLAP
jgi:hypothetical protein